MRSGTVTFLAAFWAFSKIFDRHIGILAWYRNAHTVCLAIMLYAEIRARCPQGSLRASGLTSCLGSISARLTY